MDGIEKKGSPERIIATVTSKEEFEEKWNRVKSQPIRCTRCDLLLVMGAQDLITIKKGSFKALAGMNAGSTMDIKCSRCGEVGRLRF